MRRLSNLALALMLSASLLPQSLSVHAQEEIATPSSTTANPTYAPVIDSVEPDVLATTGTMARYEVTAEMTSAGSGALASITGDLTLTYTNETGDELTELPFRLYPNNQE